MNIIQTIILEMQQEAVTTRKVLERIPESKLTWKPHEKSMTIGRLGMHIAELPGWIIQCLQTEELNFEPSSFKPKIPEEHIQIMNEFDRTQANVVLILKETPEHTLEKNWKFRVGNQIIFDLPRKAIIRNGINHMIHHRGQLSVYLRLLNVPLPNLYGPTADDKR
jgi:uncharacterized damage-inducible protein DinB